MSRVSRTDALGVVAPCDAPDEGAADRLARNLSEDPRCVGTFAAPDVRALVNHLRASPLYRRDPLLRAAVERIALGDDPLRTLGAAVLALAEERARLLKMAAGDFAAPAHNPGAREGALTGLYAHRERPDVQAAVRRVAEADVIHELREMAAGMIDEEST